MSNNARPTTVSPITAPERKATCKPLLSDARAAFAVRAEAYVAVFIPKKPAKPEKKPPVRNANHTHPFCKPKSDMIKKSIAKIKNTIITTLYCCLRYAIAPLRTCSAIFFMRSVPSSFSNICR